LDQPKISKTQWIIRDALGAGWVQPAGLEINPRGFAGYRKTTHTAPKTDSPHRKIRILQYYT
jgi:hypothetical protein